ncbi:MAG: hypothetical protein IJ115_06205 [Erysipelotrichaceae bacterium]|nr:hypothetical protein [Erysipelotrichaceae bacterium]
MKKYLIITIIVVAATFGLEILASIYRRRYYNQLIQAISTKNYEEFDRLSKKKTVRFLIPKYDMEYLKLNIVLEKGSVTEIRDQYRHVVNSCTNIRQKADILMNAFDYYVSKEDKEMAREYAKEITALGNDELSNYVKRLYDIKINKSAKLLDEMLEELNSGYVRNIWQKEMLISQAYELKGEKELQEKYEKLSRQHFEEEMKQRG